jgi:cyanoexosortase A
MKTAYPVPKRLSRKSQYWLMGTTATLVAIYMALVWLSGDVAHLGMSILFYLVVGTLLWENRHNPCLQSGRVSKVAGALLVGCVLWQSVILLHDPGLTNPQINPALRLLPVLSALAVSLLASGFKGLKQYRQELTLLFFLGGPSVLFTFLPDPSPITANFSAFLLWCSGFDVSLEGIYIRLPTGAVKVYAGCSGIESITYLLGISVIALVLFPIARTKQFFVPILAVLIGFIVNGVRVAIMAVLVASNNHTTFAYWHEGRGSLIFGVIEVLVFGLCYWLIQGRSSIAEIHKAEEG